MSSRYLVLLAASAFISIGEAGFSPAEGIKQSEISCFTQSGDADTDDNESPVEKPVFLVLKRPRILLENW
jgi:hypothetical protein